MTFYPDDMEQDEFVPDGIEALSQQGFFTETLGAVLEDEDDMDDEIDIRVDEVESRKRTHVNRGGGLFGV